MPAIVHVSRRLTNKSVHYPWEFKSIGEEFFPAAPSEFLTDQFAVYNKATLLRLDELTPLGDDEEPPNVELKWSADQTFSMKVYAVQNPGKWITEKNTDPGLDYETERTIQLTTSLRLRLEYLRVVQRLRATAFNTNYTSLAAAARFDNYTSGTSLPITTLRNVVSTIAYANGGKVPNKVAMTRYTLIAISNSEEFKDLVKYQVVQNAREGKRPANGIAALVEQLIGVDEGSILISDAVYNISVPGAAAVYTTFMGPDIVIGYVEGIDGLRKYSFTAGFQWSKYSNDPQTVIAVPRYQNTVIPVEDLRVFTVTDPNIVVTDLGYLIQNAINGADSTSYGTLVAH